MSIELIRQIAPIAVVRVFDQGELVTEIIPELWLCPSPFRCAPARNSRWPGAAVTECRPVVGPHSYYSQGSKVKPLSSTRIERQ